jgi:uncharacterized protein (TIGR03000 family)
MASRTFSRLGTALLTAGLLVGGRLPSVMGHGGGHGGGYGGHPGYAGGYHGYHGYYGPHHYHGGYYGGGLAPLGVGLGVGLGAGLALGAGLGYGLYRPYYGPGYVVASPGVGVPAVYPDGVGYGYGAAYPGTVAPGAAAGPGVPPPGTAAPAPDNAVHLQLIVPPNAEVLFDGQRTTQQGPVREFVTAPLTSKKLFTYEVTVRYTAPSGKVVTDRRLIEVRANDWFRIDFTRPAPTREPPLAPPANP